MGKPFRLKPFLLAGLVFTLAACHHKSLLTGFQQIPYYSAASAVECRNDTLYIMGDDATHLLVLDSSGKPVDSVRIFPGTASRIPKAVKADLEAATWFSPDSLLLVGSGSSSPTRNRAVWVMPSLGKTDSLRLDTLYQRLAGLGIGDLNIEGACRAGQSMILSNRGHGGNPQNWLIFFPENGWWRQSTTPLTTIRIGFRKDSSSFEGVSGLAYSPRTDQLLLTVSTEATSNTYDDGAIGKSYLWVVQQFSAKRQWKAINPNRVIDLAATDARFRGQKIESVAIERETPDFLHLVLVADNDDGKSTLFRMILEKE